MLTISVTPSTITRGENFKVSNDSTVIGEIYVIAHVEYDTPVIRYEAWSEPAELWLGDHASFTKALDAIANHLDTQTN